MVENPAGNRTKTHHVVVALLGHEQQVFIDSNAVAEALKEQFVEAEIQNVKVLGRTVFLHRSVYCNVPAENMEQIVKVLDAEGMGDVAPRLASTAKLKALLKEDEAKWKDKLGPLIKTGERYDIRNRAS